MDLAFDFIKNRGDLTKEDHYPFPPANSGCDDKKGNNPVVSIEAQEEVANNNEGALKKAVAHNPVSVAFHDRGSDLQLYIQGTRFTCMAALTRIDESREWLQKLCGQCPKKL